MENHRCSYIGTYPVGTPLLSHTQIQELYSWNRIFGEKLATIGHVVRVHWPASGTPESSKLSPLPAFYYVNSLLNRVKSSTCQGLRYCFDQSIFLEQYSMNPVKPLGPLIARSPQPIASLCSGPTALSHDHRLLLP